MDTPSPELRRTQLSRLTTPKSVACRKIMNSPAFLVNRASTDFSELSMSPLQLMDSPVQAALMTPGTSSGESSGRKSPRFLKQTSTPSDEMAQDTPTNKNKAFLIASNTFVGMKAKRRLIEDDCDESKGSGKKHKKEASIQGNAAKKQKTTPKVSATIRPTFTKNKKRAFGQINSGVSHKVRRPDYKVKPSVLSISLSDLKKAKAEGGCKNPLDALNKTLPTSQELCISSCVEETTIVTRPEVIEVPEPALRSESISTPRTSNKATALVNKQKIVPGIVVSPRSIYTSIWSSPRYRNKTEKKFFKSNGTEDRVRTVFINDNVKLEIQGKSEPVIPIHKSPRKSPRKLVQKPLIDVPTTAVESNRIEILNQDWDDDSMDMSSNIQDILNGLTEEETTEDVTETTLVQQVEEKENTNTNKLFPLFCKNSKPAQPAIENRVAKKVNPKSYWTRARQDGENQMILDAGQKEYGAVQCPDCMMVYHVKDPDDELLHAEIHQSVQNALKYSTWKKENVVRRFNSDGYIIAVHHGDSAHSWKKVENVLLKVVDQELGFSEIGIRNPETTKVYLYIAEKKIVGVLVAQSLTQGYRMLPTSSSEKCCSTNPSTALCGVNRIWTLASFRRRKIASRLLDAMRTEFIYGKIITIDEIAFSDPTDNGLAFAQYYTKRQDFLVYNM